MRYEKTIFIPQEEAKQIHMYLTQEPSCEEECLGIEQTISHTVVFEDGTEMDIKCCGVDYHEGESNTAWIEAVLFINGRQVAFTDPSNEFFAEWILKDADGNVYSVQVVEEGGNP